MDRQFCGNSEYVHKIEIGSQINATYPAQSHLFEIHQKKALAHPNSICNFEGYRIEANMS